MASRNQQSPNPPLSDDFQFEENPRAKAVETIIPVPEVIAGEDEEIFCPVCSYNLTGILSGICPECGSLFSRGALIEAQKLNAVTLIPMDDPNEMPFRERLTKTLKICLLDADKFAFAFSVQPQKTKALGFFACTTALTTLLVWLAAVSGNWALANNAPWNPRLDGLCVAVAVYTLLTITSSTLLSAIALWAFCPHYDGKHHLKPWLSITAYASAHYMLIVTSIPFLLLMVPFFTRPFFFEFVFIGLVFWLGCAGLTFFTLRTVIWLRAPREEGRNFAMLLVAVFYLGLAIFNTWPAITIGTAITDFLAAF